MSDTLDAPQGIRLGAFCGPENEGPDRRRWQIETNGIVTLRRADVFRLGLSLLASLRDRPAQRPST